MLSQAKSCADRGILYCENFLSKSCCQAFIDAFEEQEARRRTFEGILDQDFRDALFVMLPQGFNQYFTQFIETRMQPFYPDLIKEQLPYATMMFSYPVGIGFKAHSDRYTPDTIATAQKNKQPVMAGDFTILLFLNEPDAYDGGEFIFTDYQIALKPSAGTMVAFPATDDYIHSVNPITAGKRITAINRAVLVDTGIQFATDPALLVPLQTEMPYHLRP